MAPASSPLPGSHAYTESGFASVPLRTSELQVARSSVTPCLLKKKLAAGLASLYDCVDAFPLESSIFKNDDMEVKPFTEIIDLCSPEHPVPVLSNKESATSVTYHADSEVLNPTGSADHPAQGMDVDGQSIAIAAVNKVNPDWIGTSQFFIEQNVEWQENGTFNSLIKYFKALQYDLSHSPYEPSLYLEYARLVNKIGFTDIGTAAAYRALVLIEGFFHHDAEIYPKVRDCFEVRFQTQSRLVIEDEANQIYLQAYQDLLNGLLGCACFWEGLAVAKKALTIWPSDPELNESRQWLKEGFADRHNGLQDLGADPKDLVVLSRMGKIYQKLYPWVSASLYRRKPSLIREVNRHFGAGNCEVRRVFFRDPSRSHSRSISKENQDVGPLGVFATRDIQAGELVLVDQCLTAVSNIPASRFEHCDACHASLKMPFLPATEVIKPSCCNAVAYCSKSCYETAVSGYHSVLCGKDIDWLYDESGPGLSAGSGYKWRKVMFLRIIAIIIADRRGQIKKGEKPVHPLQHHAVARMAANYASPYKLHPSMPSDWQYSENIVAPTRILMMLGINIFTDLDFSQEVIQNIYWRMENNANMSIVDLSSSRPATPSPFSKPPTTAENKNSVCVICLNPQYLFFNHSCEPNISWHGAIPNPYVGIEWITGYNGEIMKPGSSAVFCKASRDIPAGEELKISYVGDPMGAGADESNVEGADGRKGKRAWLEKWFEGGCGCELCERENRSSVEADGEDIANLDLVGQLEEQI